MRYKFVLQLCVCVSLALLSGRNVAAFAIQQTEGKSNALQTSPIIVVHGVLGGRILLPCDINPPSPTDAPILVLFYVENKKTPIYSLDSRGSSLYSAYHWSDPEIENRVDFQVDFGSQGLLLHNIHSEDEGLYRCRVDFKASPTRNTRVQLDVIEPPRHLLITSKWKDERVVSKVAGPFPEGVEILLSCQVMGGKPAPKVTWWHEGSLLDDITETRTNQMTRNTLQLPPLSRNDLLKNLTCQAVNSNLTSPLSSTVSVDLAFPPTRVAIRTPNEDHVNHRIRQKAIVVSEGEKNPIRCDVEGSRPQAIIHWDIDGKNVNNKFQTIRSDSGISDDLVISSTLMLIPGAMDKGSHITCRAVNPQLPEEMLFDTAKLDVLYKPIVKLMEGKKIDLNDIKEGNDVYFECQVDANPAAHKIIWARNSSPLRHNTSMGILISSSGTSLILQDVTRDASGTYACTATNKQGASTSNNLLMNVKYIPVCGAPNESTVGGGLKEMVSASCHVRSNPSPTSYRWAFNSTRGLQDITHSPLVSYNDSGRVIQYKIQSTDDFGAFLCWASNSLGDMKDPCVINVIPAAKPEPVSQCEIFYNASIPGGQVTVRCSSGWNGGLSQTFTLEVRKASHLNTKVLTALEQASIPYFKVRDLQTGTEYVFSVTASNSRGTSLPVTLFYTIPGEVIAGLTHAHTDPDKTLEKMMPVVAIVLGVVITIIIGALVVIFVAKVKLKKRKDLQKMGCYSDSSPKQDQTSLQQTNIDSLLKESDGVSKCVSITRYDDCRVPYKGREHVMVSESAPFDPNAVLHPNNAYYQMESEGSLRPSIEFYDEEIPLRKREDAILSKNDPRFCSFDITRRGLVSSANCPSNSLGRASTVSSSSSSASRPTFRSSQSTVVFNPKWGGEDSQKPSVETETEQQTESIGDIRSESSL